ncbi:hypothetical protein J7L13_00510 [bacterium]|nr:hypothetical protein [bacterium]
MTEQKTVQNPYWKTIWNGKMLREILRCLGTINDEGVIQLTPEGLTIRLLDPSRVALLVFEISKYALEEYLCEQPVNICINFEWIFKPLKNVKKGEKVVLEQNKDKINVIIEGKTTRTYTIPTLDVPSDFEEQNKEPKLVYDSKVEAPTADLLNIIEEALLIYHMGDFTLNEEGLTLKVDTELNKVEIKVENKSFGSMIIEAPYEEKARYNLDYLRAILKAAANLAETCTLQIKKDFPLRIDFKIPFEGRMTYWQAPIIADY